jgi:hypothetical protein
MTTPPAGFNKVQLPKRGLNKNFAVFNVGADLCVCPGDWLSAGAGADTQVLPPRWLVLSCWETRPHPRQRKSTRFRSADALKIRVPARGRTPQKEYSMK